MIRQSTSPQVRRLVLVPASGRGDELIRRYRLARMRLEGRDERSPVRARDGTLGGGCRT